MAADTQTRGYAEGEDAGERASFPELKSEIEAAAAAAAAQLERIAATAAAEASLSIASAVAMSTARKVCIVFLVTAWVCVLGSGIWYLVDAGFSPGIVLLLSALPNLAIALGAVCWHGWLAGNIGFPRLRALIGNSWAASSGDRR